MPEPLFFEDLELGRIYGSDSVSVSLDDIQSFASQFDPQPFHLDPDAAEASTFKRLVASGWHTAALAMRLRVTGELSIAGGWIGLGVESLRWPQPVLPGDTLRAEMEVLEERESQSNPLRGVIRVRTSLYNQNDDLVFESVTVQIANRRPS